jgi:pimeloyl-ACP methyl ester carboxylesterase
MAADVAALVAHVDLGPVAAVGWSMGGVILQSLLIDHRQLFSSAVLLSSLPCYSELQQLWLDGTLALRRSGVSSIVLAAAGRPWGFTPFTLTHHGRVCEALELIADDPEPTSYEGFAAQAEAIRVFDRRSELKTITTPTLVLVGAEDVLTPSFQSVDIAQRIPGSKLVVLPRGGHGMLLEFPASTLGSITSFLADQGSV